jgi:hypothetical protein
MNWAGYFLIFDLWAIIKKQDIIKLVGYILHNNPLFKYAAGQIMAGFAGSIYKYDFWVY